MKTYFSEGKLVKQFGNPLLLRGLPISTNPPPPPITEQCFHDPPLCQNFQNKNTPPPPLILGGRKLCLLCVIDSFSKYAWVILLKDKKGITIIDAFQKIL